MRKHELQEEAARFAVANINSQWTVAELKHHINAHRDVHPSKPNIIVRVAEEHGHEILFTPPYMPEFQASELAWSVLKNHAIANYGNGKTTKQRIAGGSQPLHQQFVAKTGQTC
eukprot:GILJ01030366.1.p1 GENE.GILJ01030366.1~~GILJ01030366.1.p1  ORF type:complete len:114 (-),score=16.44 GILJ01030366.1:41-382(-)